jgi:exodeoxyribonuclease-3
MLFKLVSISIIAKMMKEQKLDNKAYYQDSINESNYNNADDKTDTKCKRMPFFVAFIFITYVVFTFAVALIIGNSGNNDKVTINIMQHNIEDGGQAYHLDNIVNMFRGSDVVLIQEAFTENGTDTAAEIAEILNMSYLSFNLSSTAIISRFNMELVYNMNKSALVRIHPMATVPSFYVVVLHFDDWYYQPFQAEGIPYDRDGVFQPNTTNPSELIEYALLARGKDASEIAELLNTLGNDSHVVLGGDFNEASYLDWTNKNRDAGFCPLALAFPTTQIIKNTKLRMHDCYRTLYPNEVNDLGLTWPDRKIDYPFRSDRIDMMFVDDKTTVESMKIIGGTKSDHKALNAVISFNL